jgi:hypothetical protein
MRREEIAFFLNIVANFLWFWNRLQSTKNKKLFMQAVCYSGGYCIFSPQMEDGLLVFGLIF